MKKTIIFLLTTTIVFCTYAQEGTGNFIVGILPVTTSDNAAKRYCEQVYGAIANVFTTKKRFTVVDRTKLDQIAQERNLQKQEDFIDGFIVEQGKSLGAQYLIQGNINQAIAQYVRIEKVKVISFSPYKSEKYYVNGYNVTCNINLQVIDIATGQVKGTRTINLSRQWESNSAEQAIAASLQLLESDKYTPLKDWANDMFPVAMKILKVEETDNKGRPKTVLIKGGNDMDLHRGRTKGSKLQVYIDDVMLVDGKNYTRSIPIGEIMVDEMQGEFTVCKVMDGAEEIQKRLNEGKTLLLKMTKW